MDRYHEKTTKKKEKNMREITSSHLKKTLRVIVRKFGFWVRDRAYV